MDVNGIIFVLKFLMNRNLYKEVDSETFEDGVVGPRSKGPEFRSGFTITSSTNHVQWDERPPTGTDEVFP